jgi:hypothetical protein
MHVVMVIDRNRNILCGYLNGTANGWTDGWEGAETTGWGSSYQPGSSVTAGEYHFMIGQQYYDIAADFSIDEVSVWNRALGAEEVQPLYQAARR